MLIINSINRLVFFYFIIFLFFNQISLSKTSNKDLFSFIGQKKEFIYSKEDDYFLQDNIYDEYEKLFERVKKLEKDIESMAKKNEDYLLKIEVNKIYIKLLYVLIFIFIFIIIVIIVIKFYFQCNKKIKPYWDLKNKFFDPNTANNMNTIN